MLTVLPPSETKSARADGPPLNLDSISYPELNPTRTGLARCLDQLSHDESAALHALGLSPRQSMLLSDNTALWSSPTAPAIEIYTGVLFDALDLASMSARERSNLDSRLTIGSALFGIVRASDRIPRYRLSASSKIPGQKSLRAVWKPKISALFAERDELVFDLRSGSYRALGPIDGAITLNVVSQASDGSRSVVSHFNKKTKGRIARSVGISRAPCEDTDSLYRVLTQAGWNIERPSPSEWVCVI